MGPEAEPAYREFTNRARLAANRNVNQLRNSTLKRDENDGTTNYRNI